VLRVKTGLALRLGLVVCAVLIGGMVTAGLLQALSAAAGVLLVLAALLVSLVGSLTRS
jgi:hypothetical protein